MAISKITVNGITNMDVTSDTVDAEHLLYGYTAHDASGTQITGTYVGSTPSMQTKTVTPTTSQQIITPDSGYNGLSQVTINSIPSQYIIPAGTKSITANGTGIDVAAYANVDVAVPSGTPSLQSKTATPTEQQQIIQPDNGYDGLNQVTVGAISSTYIGSGIDQRDSDDLTASGATVTVPAGYYSAATSKSINNASLIFNSVTNSEPLVARTNNKLTFVADVDVRTANDSVGGYIASNQQTLGTVKVYLYSNEPYFNDNSELTTSGATVTVPAGYYATSVSKSVTSGSATVPASITDTAATVSTGTNTLTLTKSISVTPSVTAGYVSSGTTGNSSVSLTANVTTKAAATITPSTTNQTIAANTYLTGAQTIAGDADLVASNIISTANIFGVQGSVVVQNYYTGSSAPSSSLGQNGDIYLQE